MTHPKLKRDKVFISYSHADKKWLQRLQVYLKPLSREGKVDWWDDTKIKPGMNWREEITKALNSAKVAVLLISADFLASDFIAEYELPLLLKAAKTEGATILPVIVSPSRFNNDKSLSEFQAVNDPSNSLIEMNKGKRERLWVKLIDQIEIALATADHTTEHTDEIDSQRDYQSASIEEPSLILPDLTPAVGVFIDRKEHIKAIREFIVDDARRLVTVQGLPGIGKSTLAAKLVEEIRERFKSVLWIKCRADQTSPDVLFSKLYVFFERTGEQGLRGVWNNPRQDQLEMKINSLIQILDRNSYLLIFDEFQNWLTADFQMKNAEVRQVLANIFGSAHHSKVVLISDQRPLLDPLIFHLPVGSKMECTLLGLDKPDATQLLSECGLNIRDKEVLNRIIDQCDGNPYMLQIFSYLVSGLHRDPMELLASGESGTEFNELLQEVTKDLSEESHSILGLLSILRLPVERKQIQALGPRFDSLIGTLINRFLVIEDTQTNRFNVSTVVRNFVTGTLSETERHELHGQAIELYMKQHSDHDPLDYEELQVTLEEGYHRFEYGDLEGGAQVIMSVTPFLVDWGYIELAEQNIFLASKNTKNQRLTAQCLGLTGSIADLRGDYPAALEHFKHALQMYELADDYGGIARTLFRIGRIHNALNQFDLADEYFQRCIGSCEDHGVTDGWAASLLGMGWNRQQRSSDIDKVIDLYKKSMERAELSSDIETLSSAHRQIGFLLWTTRRQKEESHQHYEQALQVSEKYKLIKEIGAIHSEMGYLYEEWGEYDKAEQSCQQAIQIFKAVGNNYGLSGAYLNLGKVFESKQDLEAAIVWYNLSRSISARINNPGGQAYACFRLGKILRQQGKYAEAEAVLLKALRLSKEHDLMETLTATEEQLSQIKLLSA